MIEIHVYDQLKKLNLINWSTLLAGFERGLISRHDIEDWEVAEPIDKSPLP